MRFEDLDAPERTAALAAAREFMQKNDYTSLPEACEALGMPLPDLWEKIVSEAGLPPCDAPVFSSFG
jgi:hypothetical protein